LDSLLNSPLLNTNSINRQKAPSHQIPIPQSLPRKPCLRFLRPALHRRISSQPHNPLRLRCRRHRNPHLRPFPPSELHYSRVSDRLDQQPPPRRRPLHVPVPDLQRPRCLRPAIPPAHLPLPPPRRRIPTLLFRLPPRRQCGSRRLQRKRLRHQLLRHGRR
ncbi:hypothetical protein LINPERPRIM_LOCUS28818, partial [Linum perenne]